MSYTPAVSKYVDGRRTYADVRRGHVREFGNFGAVLRGYVEVQQRFTCTAVPPFVRQARDG